MKSPLPHFSLLVLAAVFLTQCASKPKPPANPYGGTAYLNGNAGYAAPAAPAYQPVAYRPNPSQPVSPYGPGSYGQPGPMMPPPQQQPYYSPPQMSPVPSGPSSLSTSAPYIHAESYILIDANNGQVLAAKNADTVRGVASTQKVLTALIVAEEGDLDQMIRVTSSDVAVEPSKMGVRPGEMYSRRQLLIGFLVKSANDVANTLARDNAGSIAAFSSKMTSRARSLGAMQSSFRNPHGLTASGQYSTARDMSRIAIAAYRNPVIRDAVRRRYYPFRFATGRTTTLENTNDLLGLMAECNGMKTGYTAPAGRCLISTAHGRRRDVILVQLGTRTKYIWDDGAALMRWGLNR